MLWRRPRRVLFLCAGLDLVGLLVCAFLVELLQTTAMSGFPPGLVFVGVAYLLFSWLFGSYTVLRWPWLRLRLVLLRLALASTATLLVVIVADWALNLPEALAFTHRFNQLLLLAPLTLWSLGLRLVLRRLSCGNPELAWQLMAEPEEAHRIQSEWRHTPYVLPPRVLQQQQAGRPAGVASSGPLPPALQRQMQQLIAQGVPVASVQELAEKQLERLPPALLPEEWMAIHQIPWNNFFSVQRQLKRAADVGLSLLLLALTLPLLLVLGLLIWLEDRGPVFYCQWRSGLMGAPFRLIKLRTMRCSPSGAPARWTQPGDGRITRIGQLLRRTRLDELPQLINVLRGEMSLIGPRPERPELEHQLEARIPHYRKRHWMPPGLSGWAQVCAPYAASLPEVELKLSYDLFYLRNWSTGLDLLILAKTIKTVLKASGR